MIVALRGDVCPRRINYLTPWEWNLVAVDENIHDLGVILRRVVDVPKMCFVNLVLAVKYSGNSL